MNVELVIDEVVLRGVPPEQAHAVAAAIEGALAELAGESARTGDHRLSDRAEASRALPAVDAAVGSPADLGRAVAGAVWGTLSTGGRG